MYCFFVLFVLLSFHLSFSFISPFTPYFNLFICFVSSFFGIYITVLSVFVYRRSCLLSLSYFGLFRLSYRHISYSGLFSSFVSLYIVFCRIYSVFFIVFMVNHFSSSYSLRADLEHPPRSNLRPARGEEEAASLLALVGYRSCGEPPPRGSTASPRTTISPFCGLRHFAPALERPPPYRRKFWTSLCLYRVSLFCATCRRACGLPASPRAATCALRGSGIKPSALRRRAETHRRAVRKRGEPLCPFGEAALAASPVRGTSVLW